MDIFKKIYTTLIFLTIIALSYICLITLGAIKINLTDETTIRVVTSAVSILIMGILFSRTANVISNRNARIIGYLGTFSGLINLILVALKMIASKNEFINTASNVMLYVTIFIFLIVLVFEIPRSNSAHGKFQIITAVIIGITAVFPYITGLRKIDSNPLSLINSNYELTEENKENKETLNNINTILTFISVGTFLINPMLRVFYIDKDYYALNEINDALTNARPYQENNQYNTNYENLSDKYKKDVQTTTQIPTPTPTPVNEVHLPPPTIAEPTIQEMPQEKVINEQFKPEELPEAIIPSITGLSEPATTNLTQQIDNVLTQPEPTPVVQPEPVTVTQPEPVTVTQPEPTPVVQPENVVNQQPTINQNAVQTPNDTTNQQ